MRLSDGIRASLRRLRGPIGDLAVVVVAALIVAHASLRAVLRDVAVVDLLPAEVSIGPIPEGEEREIRLTIVNRGGEPVDLTVVPSCTCMTPDAGPLRVPGSGIRTFSVRVSTARKPGFNASHVQVADASGAIVAQSLVTFTALRAYVVEPPALFLRGGESRATCRIWCLAGAPPGKLEAVSEDPAVTVSLARVGRRSWEVAASLAARPLGSIAQVRIVEPGPAGASTVGLISVSVPNTRIGCVRSSQVAEDLGGGRLRAWILVDTEAPLPFFVRGLRASGAALEWRTESSITESGSFLWVELLYAQEDAGATVDLEAWAGEGRETIRVALPAGTGGR